MSVSPFGGERLRGLPSGPSGGDQPPPETPDQRAYRLVVALYGPSEGDVQGAVEALRALAWPALWPTLDRLAKDGPGLDSATYLERFYGQIEDSQIDPRVMAAVAVALLRAGGRVLRIEGSDSRLETLATLLLGLPGEDQLELLGHVGITGEDAEGTIAILEALLDDLDAALRDPAGAAAAAVTPGIWNPGNQPVGAYIGLEAHSQIAARYTTAHPRCEVWTNTSAMTSIAASLGRRYGFTPGPIQGRFGALKPDILDISGTHDPWLYEIKPAHLQKVGAAEARLYRTVFLLIGPMELGPTDAPGTRGRVPAPGGWYDFTSPEPGVITYRYRRQRAAERVPAPDPRRERRPGQDRAARSLDERLMEYGRAGGRVDLDAAAKAGGLTLLVAVLLIALENGGWVVVFAL